MLTPSVVDQCGQLELDEIAARAGKILALNIENLDLDAHRTSVVSKGGAIEYVYWATGTARLLRWLIAGRNPGAAVSFPPPPGSGPSAPGPGPCPQTGRARLGYDRARVLLDRHTSPGGGALGWDLHQLRHSAGTTLGEKNASLQLIMAKTRHRNPRTVMRYIKPGADALTEVTRLLDVA
jgi:integrase